MTDLAGKTVADYERADSAVDNGLECCAACGVTLGIHGPRTGPIFDADGREYESFYDTDPLDGPWFCEECYPTLRANKKRQENRALEEWSA